MQRVLLNLAGCSLVPNRVRLLLPLLLVFFGNLALAQSSGIFESYAILSINGGANAYYDMQATTGNPDFQGNNLGSFAFGTNTLVVKGGQNKTFKNGGCDITGSTFYYRVYKTGNTPGSFVSIAMPFDSNMANPGDQIWQGTSGATNLIASLTPGAYTLEVYSESTYTGCGSGTHFSSNLGANYKATFTVTGTNPVFVTATGGTAIASYTTLKGAFDAVNAGTHTGTINVEISGNTTETAAASLNASGSGSASYTTLKVTPTGARTVTASLASEMIILNGADNVTFDGLNTGGNSLVLSNTSTASTSGTCTIRFIGGATGNTFTNCTILGSSTTAIATNGGTIFFSTDSNTANGNDNNTFSNCTIGPAGANLPSKAVYGNGSVTTKAIGNSGIVFNNNNIFDFFAAGGTSAGFYIPNGCNGWSITNNKFYQTGARTWTTGAQHSPIWITTSATGVSGAQGFTITGNIIGYASDTQTGVYTLTGAGSNARFWGIHFNGLSANTSDVTTISNNTVAAVSMTGVTGSGTSNAAPFIAIHFQEGIGVSNNNVIGSQSATGSLTFSTTTSSSTDVYGILNYTSNSWTSNSNTVGGISATNLGSGTTALYGIRCFTSSSVSWTANSNTIGGTIANSIQLSATSTSSQVFGLYNSVASSALSSNIVRNLATNIGTGTTSGASAIGISITATQNATLAQNTVLNLSNSNTSAASVVIGMYVVGLTNTVERNFIHSLTAATTSASGEISGIRVAGGTTTYKNNMIALGTGVANALQINGIVAPSGTDNFYHNSVYIGGSPTAGTGNSYAFNSTVTSNTRAFRDNIFVNNRSNGGATGKNYIVRVGGTTANPAGLTINNNVYFGNGTGNVFGFFNSLDVANLAAWKTAVGQDASSFNADPQYLAPTASTPDLHINPSVGTIVEAAGAAIAGVTDDFDGQTRSGLTPTDIGADAGNFTTLPIPTITSLGSASGCVGSSLIINGTNLGAVTSATIGGTAATVTGTTATTATVTVGSGTTGIVSVTSPAGTANGTDTFTVNPLPANPANPTSNSPQCFAVGVTLMQPGSAPGGETWYWQTAANGTTVSPGVNDQPTYVVTVSGTYYLRSLSSFGCWSAGAGSLAVVVNNVPNASVTPSPANAATGVCFSGSGAITSVSWATTATATSYDVYFAAGTLPVGVTANVATNSYSTGTLLANTTYHWKVVAKNGCGDAVGSTEWTFTTAAGICYCASTGGTSDGISGVTFNGMTNTGTGINTYTDYTATKIVTVNQGATYSGANGLAVYVNTGGNFTNHQSVYIDWNKNGLFTDSGEFYSLGTATNVTNGLSSLAPLSITVPAGAALGTTRMRVQSKFSSATGSPCLTSFDGEVEDYAVNVLAPALPTITSLGSASGCAGSSITINGTDLSGAVASGVTIGGTPVASITSNSGTVLVAVIGSGTTGTVSVTTLGGTATSAATFSVNPLPVINTQPAVPAAACATVGITTISVAASGATTYQWRRNGVNLSNVAPYSGADTATLTITSPAQSDAGSFDVIVGTSLGCSVTSNAVALTVNPAPLPTTGITICQGGSGNLTATACPSFVNAGTTISGTWAATPIALRPTTSISNTATCSFDATVTRNYVATNFQVSTTGNYTFTMNNSTAFDGMGYIVTGAFVPGSCASGTWVKGDDDGGSNEPIMTATLTQGVTYTLISTNYGSASGTYIGSFGWTITPPAGGQILLPASGTIDWYTAASGGTSIGSGTSFNPVGVANSGLANTNTPGTTTYYAACSLNPNCRTATNFTINANVTYYADTDGDTYGNLAAPQVSCTGAPGGYVLNSTDCDDTNNAIHQTFPFYVDNDHDTYGTGSLVPVCAIDANTPPTGYSLNNTDCNDNNVNIYQNGLFYTDADGDGYTVGAQQSICYGATTPAGYSVTSNGEDCNDSNNAIYQNGLFYTDADGDGYTVGAQQSICYGATTPAGYSVTSNGEDCNDSNNAIYQNGLFYTDADGDGYTVGAQQSICYGATTPAGYSVTSNGTDCDDTNNALHDTFQFYTDNDGDGFGSGALVNVCAANGTTPPSGYSLNNTDCNDGNNTVWQSATLYVDADSDGYTTGATQVVCYGAAVPSGFVAALTAIDCNDAVAAIHPNAVEVPYNGVDDDCDNAIDETGTVTTTLLGSSCGVTLASIQSLVGITTVAGHNITGYRIRITNGAQVQVIEKIVPHFTFPQFPSYAYATTYTVDIQLQRAGIWQASWGAPCLVSTPAILEEGGAASVSPSQCGIVLPKINTLIATSSIAGVTGYRFRVTNLTDPLGPNAIQQIDRTQNWFSLQMLTRYNYGTTYRIEVAVKTTGTYGGFGAPCEVSSPAAPALVNCGGTVAAGTTTVAATSVTGATQYRFQIVRDSDGASTTIDRSTNWFIFNSVPASAFSPGVLYNVRVAVMTTGTWSPFGDICQITSPGTAAKGTPSGVQAAATEFRATAYPNPFTAEFGIDVTSSSKENVKLQVYDMLGKLIESREVKLSDLDMEKIGTQYPSGVYNVIVSQDGVVKTLRVIKR